MTNEGSNERKYVIATQLDGKVYVYSNTNQELTIGDTISVKVKFTETKNYKEGAPSEAKTIKVKGKQSPINIESNNNYFIGTTQEVFTPVIGQTTGNDVNPYCVVYDNGKYYLATQAKGEESPGAMQGQLVANVTRTKLSNNTTIEYAVVTYEESQNAYSINLTNEFLNGLTWKTATEIQIANDIWHEEYSQEYAYILVRKIGTENYLPSSVTSIKVKKCTESLSVVANMPVSKNMNDDNYTINVDSNNSYAAADLISAFQIFYMNSYNVTAYEDVTSLTITGTSVSNAVSVADAGKTITFTCSSLTFKNIQINVYVNLQQ